MPKIRSGYEQICPECKKDTATRAFMAMKKSELRRDMPQKTVREILVTTLITACGEYAVAKLSRPIGADRSDITTKLANKAIASIKALMLEWVGEDKGRGSVVPVEDVYSVPEVQGYINGFNDRGAEMRQKIDEATK
jgi:hypothetical protein